MSAEFLVENVRSLGEDGVIISGVIQSGLLTEGTTGRTIRGKSFTVVKIERDGCRVVRFEEKARLELFAKHVNVRDIWIGETIYLG